jgi:hypothetical protein
MVRSAHLGGGPEQPTRAVGGGRALGGAGRAAAAVPASAARALHAALLARIPRPRLQYASCLSIKLQNTFPIITIESGPYEWLLSFKTYTRMHRPQPPRLHIIIVSYIHIYHSCFISEG